MKYHVTYTRVLTLEEEIEASTQQEAHALAEERSSTLLNAEYRDADCSWDVELAEEPYLDPDMDYRVSPPVRAYPPVECPWTERLSWGW